MRKLQLGAFDQGLDGWTNTDITPHLFIARIPGLSFGLNAIGLLPLRRYEQHRNGIFGRLRYLNVGRRFPFDDGSFGCIYSAHMLEHLPVDVATNCLSEAYRVLSTGGVLRIAVPDLDQLIRDYDPDDAETFLETFFEPNRGLPKNGHHWHYNENLLRKNMEAVGFTNVLRRSFRCGKCPDLDRIECREESLFMEAIK